LFDDNKIAEIIMLINNKTNWIWHPEVEANTPCFMLFRRTFETQKEARISLNVSADNRYNLFLDGKVQGRGPCKGDLHHYNYETYEFPVSPGKHVLSSEVVVYNYGFRGGEEGPLAEAHAGGGFIVAGGAFVKGKKEVDFSVSEEWRCFRDESRVHRGKKEFPAIKNFFAIAPLEKVSFKKSIGNWKEIEFDDSAWREPRVVGNALIAGEMSDSSSKWWLTPRQIPMMEEGDEPVSKILKIEGIDAASIGIKDGRLSSVKLPSGKTVKLVLDMGRLTTAFPRMEFSGAEGATVKATYSESLFIDGKKLVRDDVKGEVEGCSDFLELCDDKCVFEPFWFRTFRFVELEIVIPSGKELLLESFSAKYFMYPFDLKAEYDDSSGCNKKVWDIAWRTARLCAHEHYEDCPYYEQLQYAGDTRIQALISYCATGDGRLGKQALRQFDWSRLAEGIGQSRYPASWVQVIPGFTLFWVMMVHDYYWYFADEALVKELLPGIKIALNWFERCRINNGLLGHLNFWNFTDWVDVWPEGNSGRGLDDKPQTINSLLYAEACRKAAYLCEIAGELSSSKEFMERRKISLEAVNKYCYDRISGLYVDMPGTKYTSQHVNAFAIISDAANTSRTDDISVSLAANKSLSQATLYFSFYLFRAWEKAETYDYFPAHLQKWHSMLKWNFTTFPEWPTPDTRSDCHAWSASPIYEFITCVLGIKPAVPGFSSVLVKPLPCEFKSAKGKAPVGDQIMEVEWSLSKGEMEIEVKLEKPKRVIIEWPDGHKERLDHALSGIFSHKSCID
jgi:hypothetical protein